MVDESSGKPSKTLQGFSDRAARASEVQVPESINIMLKGKKVVPLKKQRTNTSTKSYKMGG